MEPPGDRDKIIDHSSNVSDKHERDVDYESRVSGKVKAIVTDVRSESPTVRGITLRIDHPEFNFKAGQWVDVFIQGINTIGGFSMYSSPKQLTLNRTIELGVQFSDWPPTSWMHNQCKINSAVEVQVGGNLYYDPKTVDGDISYDLLLIAGGVGINPLASIFLHANDLHGACSGNRDGYRPGKVCLLFSAKTKKELLYKTMLESIPALNPELEVRFFITRECFSNTSNITHGRITSEVLKSTLSKLNSQTLRAFICGPTSMIDQVEDDLLKSGLSKKQILYEKWW